MVNGVVVESLFNGWDNTHKKYFEYSEQSRRNLLKEVNQVKQMGLPVTIVDYIGSKDADKAEAIAHKIAALGFNPWVTDGTLEALYLYHETSLPRKILLFYEGALNNINEKIGSDMSNAVSMPLNHLGYITEFRNLAEPLPMNLSSKEYAGIVIGMEGFLDGRQEEIIKWYKSLLSLVN